MLGRPGYVERYLTSSLEPGSKNSTSLRPVRGGDEMSHIQMEKKTATQEVRGPPTLSPSTANAIPEHALGPALPLRAVGS